MTKLTFTLILISTLFFAFATPGEESVYDGASIAYNVIKTNGVVTINLDLKNPEDIESVVLMRGNNPSTYFRDVKHLSEEEVANLTSNGNTLQDKYPLPSTVETYYRIQTTDKSGVLRTYPSVKLSAK